LHPGPRGGPRHRDRRDRRRGPGDLALLPDHRAGAPPPRPPLRFAPDTAAADGGGLGGRAVRRAAGPPAGRRTYGRTIRPPPTDRRKSPSPIWRYGLSRFSAPSVESGPA